MKNIIYTFTGTGNSLAAAKQVAEILEDCQILPMKAQFSSDIKYDRIGIVFPTYYVGLPNAVRNFLLKAKLNSEYLFAVVTNGGTAGNSVADVNHILSRRSYHLSYGTTIKSHSNNLKLYPMYQNVERTTKSQFEKIEEVAAAVLAKASSEIPTGNFIFALYNNVIMNKISGTDRSYVVSDACNSCEICSKVCPVDNIEIVDGKPSFHHNCEQCMACIQWCPNEAINIKRTTLHWGRYHHPDVSLQELINFLHH